MTTENKNELRALAVKVAMGKASFAATKEMILDEMGEEAWNYFVSVYMYIV